MIDFTTGSVTKKIIQFTIPLLIGNVFQQFYNLVDSMIVGHFLGKQALAAVTASSQLVFVMIALLIGVGIGASVVIGQHWGRKDNEKVRLTAGTINIFLLVASIFIGLLGMLFSEPLLRLVNVPAEAFPEAKIYLTIYLGGLFSMFGYNAITATLRGLGDSKVPLYALILANVLNIGLDLLFILVFHWGVAGAAWATILAQSTSWVALLIYLKKTNSILSVGFYAKNFNLQIFKDCLKIGLPSGIQQTVVGVGLTAILGMVNQYGVDVAAGFGAGTRIDSFISMLAMNFSIALTSFTAQNFGAGLLHRLKQGLISTLLLSIGITVIVNGLVILFRVPLITLFTDKTNVLVIQAGADYLIVVSIFYLFFSTMFVFTGFLRGTGNAFYPMLTSIFSLWLIRLPLAYYLSIEWGFLGICYSVPLSWIIGVLANYLYYASGHWKRKLKQAPSLPVAI